MMNMDMLTGLCVSGAVHFSKLVKPAKWKKGEPLKMLLVGYNGKRNTGADVRVAAMVEQFNHVFGAKNIEISVLTLDEKTLKVYYDHSARLVPFTTIFFKDLMKACSENHVAVLSEGSCFKSKFANALAFFFCEAAGVMKAQNKPCIAYGTEAGDMDPFVKDIVQKLCSETYVIARTEPSLDIIKELGFNGRLGTDTAWTFKPGSKDWARQELMTRTGWDGNKPLVGAAVINPFCWPVKPNLSRLAKSIMSRTWEDHYEKWYFFSASDERKRSLKAYIQNIAKAIDDFADRYDAHPVIFGMEALDLNANKLLKQALKHKTDFFCSTSYDGYQMTALLRSLDMLVTSRYHARVLSMPGGVPSIAVSMDERLYNLLRESGHLEDYYLEVHDPHLDTKLLAAMEKMWSHREQVKEDILKTIPFYLKIMAEMAQFYKGYVREQFPGIELTPDPADWRGYLAPLYPELKAILDKYGKPAKKKPERVRTPAVVDFTPAPNSPSLGTNSEATDSGDTSIN